MWVVSCAGVWGARATGHALGRGLPQALAIPPICWCCPWQEGPDGVRPRARAAQGEGPSSRATLLGCSSTWRPTGWGRAGLSFPSRALRPAAPDQQVPSSQLWLHYAFSFFLLSALRTSTCRDGFLRAGPQRMTFETLWKLPSDSRFLRASSS